MAKILIIDDEESLRFTFDRFLSRKGHEVFTAQGYDDALARIDERDYDLIFADILLEDGTGIDVLRTIRTKGLYCPLIMITGDPNVDTAMEAIRLGAFDYIPKPVTEEMLLRATGMALKYKELMDEKERYRSNLESIFRSLKDSIVTSNKDARVIAMNEAATRMCGLPPEAIGRKFRELLKDCNGVCADYLDEAIRKNGTLEDIRIDCLPHDRPGRVVNLSASPLLNPQGAFSGVVMVFRDETRLVNLESEVKSHKQFYRLVGRSEKMQKVYSLIEALANSSTTALITGETGTGKELAAEALHSGGGRSTQPLVKVNCSALPENLLESELFGHVKGAFTGAIKERIGRFQKADGGTILLDEVGDLSPNIQARLLRVLQEKEFERVGDSTPIKLDVRVIAATNKDLREKVKTGEFREDLYYRLKVVEIEIPPLRERRDDIPLLVDHFCHVFNTIFNKTIEAVSNEVMQVFLNYAWPGNVRELEHILEHAFVLCRAKTITLADLPRDFLTHAERPPKMSVSTANDELQIILDVLKQTGGNKAKAARLLGMDRTTLYRKLQKWKQ